MKFKCIFFDFDGVIVENSQHIAFDILRDELKNFGLYLTPEYLVNNFLGIRGEQIINLLNRNLKIQIPGEIVVNIRKLYREKLLKNAKLGTNLTDLLSKVEEHFICSSSELQRINEILSIKKIKHYFPDQNIFSYDKVKSFKPSPEVYLAAMEKTSIPVNLSCAIEDSSVGVLAAKKAGLHTMGYVGGFSLSTRAKLSSILKKSGVDNIIDDFAKV